MGAFFGTSPGDIPVEEESLAGKRTPGEEQVARAEKRRAKREGPPVAPVPPPTESQFSKDTLAPPGVEPVDTSIPDINAIVPATGETWGGWLDRRFSMVASIAPNIGKALSLEFAASDITDQELEGSIKFIQQAIGTRAKSKAETLQEEIDDILESIDGRSDIEELALAASDPQSIKLAWGRALERTGGVADDKTAQVLGFDSFNDLVAAESLLLEQDTQTAASFFGASNEELDEAIQPPSILGDVFRAFEFFAAPSEAGRSALSTAGGVVVQVSQLPAKGFAKAFGKEVEILSPKEMIARGESLGIGRNIAIESGLEAGTAPFEIVSRTADFFAALKLDPLLIAGKVGAGLKAASKLPKGARTGRGLQQAVFNKFAREPHELVKDAVAQKKFSSILRDIRKQQSETAQTIVNGKVVRVPGELNPAAILDKHNIPAGLIDDVMSAKSVDDLQDIFLDGLMGRATGATQAVRAKKLVDVGKKLDDAKKRIKTLPKNEMTKVVRESAEAEIRGLRKQRQALKKSLEAAEPEGVISDIGPSRWREFRQAFLGRDKSTLLGRIVGFLGDSEWARKGLSRRLARSPKAASLDDLDEVVLNFDRMGRFLGVPRKEIDNLTNRVLKATSDEEIIQLTNDLLMLGRGRLPQGVARELTQWASNPGGSITAVDDAGRQLASWVNKSSDVAYAQPLFVNQIHRTLPVPNMEEIARAFSWSGKLKSALRGQGTGKASEFVFKLPGPAQIPLRAFAGGLEVASKLTHAFTAGVWVPSVLARLGWTLRVSSDNMARILSVGVNPLEENLVSLFGRINLSKGLRQQAVKEGKTLTRRQARIEARRLMEIPEEGLSNYGRLAMQRRVPPNGAIARGDKGYYDALAERLNFFSNDPVVQQVLRRSDDEVVAWLRGRGKEWADQMAPVVEKATGSRDDLLSWVKAQREALNAALPSEALKDAVRTGVVRVKPGIAPKLENGGLPQYLRLLKQEELPKFALPTGEMWRLSDPSLWRRGTAAVMEFLGSKPDNFLSRRPVYRKFFKAEKARFKKLGWSDDLAEQEAKRVAIKRIGELVYDTTERSAFDLQFRAIAPFLPAWKEVMKRWLVTIPARQGMGLGHATIARKAQVAFNALKDEGLIKESPEGELEFRVPGIEKFVAEWIGVKGTASGLPVSSANMIFNFPGVGPVATLAAEKIVARSSALDGIADLVFPFGFSRELGPRALSRVLRGIGLSVPYDFTPPKAQQALYDLSLADVLRTDEFQKRLAAIGEQDLTITERERAFDEITFDAERKAQSVMLRRGFLGMLMPIQPHLYWPDQEEVRRFRAGLEKAIPGDTEEAREARGRAIGDFLDKHPELRLAMSPKTLTINREDNAESSFGDFLRSVVEGDVKTLQGKFGMQGTARVFQGIYAEGVIRREEREALADIGASPADWLRNAYLYEQIKDRRRDALSRLEHENPQWAEWKKIRVGLAKERQGEPVPTTEEELLADVADTLRAARGAFAPILDLDSSDRGILGKALVNLSKTLEDKGFYSDRELPPGPERNLQTYYTKHFVPYHEKRSELFDKLDKVKTPTERDRIFLELRRLANDFEDPVIDGDTYPSPEAESYFSRSPEEREQLKRRWLMSPRAWLSSFQRDQLGLEDNSTSVKFWDRVSEVQIQLKEFINKKGFHPSSSEARTLREGVESWAEATASGLGIANEWRISQQPNYQRLEPIIKGDRWKRISQVADGAWAALRAADVGPQSTLGLQVQAQTHRWLDSFREANENVDTLLDRLQQASPEFARKTREGFYSFLLFGD